jgi:hypothetical protein
LGHDSSALALDYAKVMERKRETGARVTRSSAG